MSSSSDLFEGKEQVARIEDQSEQAEQNRAHNSSEVLLIGDKVDIHMQQ